jgi:hypothetical protein
LNNKGIMNKVGEEVILTLGLTNKDPMNGMEVLKNIWDKGNDALENTWAHLNPAGPRMGVSTNVRARREGEWYL